MKMLYDGFQTATRELIEQIVKADNAGDTVTALEKRYLLARLKADYYDQHVDSTGTDHSESQKFIVSQAERAWREVGDARDNCADGGVSWENITVPTLAFYLTNEKQRKNMKNIRFYH